MPVETNSYDFLISDKDEIMLILYARDIAPEEPAVRLNPENKTIELYRRFDDAFTLESVEDEVFALLQNAEQLLVCEILPLKENDETEIVYAYHAIIVE